VDATVGSIDISARPKARRFPTRQTAIVAMLLLTAVVTRFSAFGNPLFHVDDQFYLLVGQSMLHGQLPYVDIWDRKPLGLFLIYAAIAALGGSGIPQYQIVAGLFALATALVIQRIASRLANTLGSTLAGMSYLMMLPLFGGQGGQSPVFYNLFISGAVLLAIQAIEDGSVRRLQRCALVAMLLCGLAMTVKQVSFVEGAFVGLMFLSVAHRKGMPVPSTVRLAAAMIAVALLPTILCLLAYAAAGHLSAFVYANFISIFQKSGHGPAAKLAGLEYLLIFMGPLMVLALCGSIIRFRSDIPRPQIRTLVNGWVIASALGLLVVPNFYDHYDLPLLAPLCVSASTFLARPFGPLFAGILLIFSNSNGDVTGFARNQHSKAVFARMTATVSSNLDGGCLFVASGPGLLYSAVPACRLTPYLFGDHLMLRVERGAVGTDTGKELQRILSLRPSVVVFESGSTAPVDPLSRALLASELVANYRLVETEEVYERLEERTYQVWALRRTRS
jgi:hypothetical protein